MTYGQYARGASLSFVEPYLLDYRVAFGLDVTYREQLANDYISYGTTTLGFSPRLGFALREDLSLQLRYSLYQQSITLPTTLDNCNNLAGPAFLPTPTYINSVLGGVDPTGNAQAGLLPGCLSDGESSLPVREELANGPTWTSSLGYSLDYNTLDNTKNPTDGLLVDFKQDFAGVGGDVSYLKSAIDAKYYAPLVADIVGLVHVQSGILNSIGNTQLRMLDQFQMGPNLVRGFAPNGIGPRDLTFSNQIRATLADVKIEPMADEPALSENWGEEGLSAAERLYAWNTLEVLAMSSGNIENPANAIPGRAQAMLQLRFVVGTGVDKVIDAVRAHLHARGFPMVEVRATQSFAASRTDFDSLWINWAAQSIRQTTGKPPAVLPNFGGSLPNDVFSDCLGLPTIWVPHSYPGCSQHAPNEHILLPVTEEALGIMAGLFWDLGEMPRPL